MTLGRDFLGLICLLLKENKIVIRNFTFENYTFCDYWIDILKTDLTCIILFYDELKTSASFARNCYISSVTLIKKKRSFYQIKFKRKVNNRENNNFVDLTNLFSLLSDFPYYLNRFAREIYLYLTRTYRRGSVNWISEIQYCPFVQSSHVPPDNPKVDRRWSSKLGSRRWARTCLLSEKGRHNAGTAISLYFAQLR